MNSQLPKVIGISGISGAGKSTLIKHLLSKLQATVVFWDDFDRISQGPDDYIKWYAESRDYGDWHYPDLAETLKTLKAGNSVVCPATGRLLEPAEFILFDAPLGRCHLETGIYIDQLVCLDTPPDIALARRLMRDYKDAKSSQEILEGLDLYLSEARPLFLLTPDEKRCDLIVDGSLPVGQQTELLLDFLQGIKREGELYIAQAPLTEELKKQIYSGFSRHAIAATGYDEKSDPVSFVAKRGKIFAGAVVAELFWGALHVKYVFVEEHFRSSGLGSRLLQEALAYGRGHNCPFAFVETMSFQALAFYQKLGFQLEFSRQGLIHGASFHYLRKDL